MYRTQVQETERTMATSYERDIRTTPEFKSHLEDLAHEKRVSLSTLLRTFTEEYANGLDETIPLPSRTAQSARMRIVVPEETWLRAQSRATREGTTLAEEIRKLAEAELAR